MSKLRKFLKSDIGRGIRRVGDMALKQSPMAAEYAMASRALKRGRGIYTGMGEYVAEGNDLIQTKSSMSTVPEFGKTDDDSIIISRREYICEIFGPDYIGNSTSVAPFVIQTFPINPGLESTFPWLSQIAQNYDEYELMQCIFTFKSTTTESTNSQNGQVGTVIMCTNYNASAPSFRDKATMQRYMGANSARITETILHGVECDPAKLSGSAGEYIRTNPVVTAQDIKTYDHAKFQIAVANAADVYANVSLGELWVSYTVKLRKSKFFTSLGFGLTRDIFVSKGGETSTLPFGTNLLRGQQNNLGCILNQASSNVSFTFPGNYAGYLSIMICMEGSGMSIYTNSITLQGNVRVVRDIYGTNNDSGDAPGSQVWATQAAANVWIQHLRVDIATNGVDNVINIPLPQGGTINQCYAEVCEYNAVFSGLNQGINDSDSPVWVNSSGIVEVP